MTFGCLNPLKIGCFFFPETTAFLTAFTKVNLVSSQRAFWSCFYSTLIQCWCVEGGQRINRQIFLCVFFEHVPSQNNKSLVQELTTKESGQKLFKHAICYHIKFFLCRNVDSLQRVPKTILPKTLVRSCSEVCYCNEYSISFFVSKVRAKNICIRVLLLWLFSGPIPQFWMTMGRIKTFM